MVYFTQARNGLIKIGMTGNINHRMSDLRREYGALTLLAAIPDGIEAEYHFKFRAYWVSGEWFAPDTELVDFIQALPKSDECQDAVARGRVSNPNVGWEVSNSGLYPRPKDMEPSTAQVRECENILRTDSTVTLETRIATATSREEVTGWMRAAMNIANEREQAANAVN